MWYLRHIEEFKSPLKSNKDFCIDRAKEILEIYRRSYNIQPITGCFAKAFEYLKERDQINDDFFEIRFHDFEKEYSLDLLQEKLDKIEEFISNHNRIPDGFARFHIPNLKNAGKDTKNVEDDLRYEGKLMDDLISLKKKNLKPDWDPTEKSLIKIYFAQFSNTTNTISSY